MMRIRKISWIALALCLACIMNFSPVRAAEEEKETKEIIRMDPVRAHHLLDIAVRQGTYIPPTKNEKVYGWWEWDGYHTMPIVFGRPTTGSCVDPVLIVDRNMPAGLPWMPPVRGALLMLESQCTFPASSKGGTATSVATKVLIVVDVLRVNEEHDSVEHTRSLERSIREGQQRMCSEDPRQAEWVEKNYAEFEQMLQHTLRGFQKRLSEEKAEAHRILSQYDGKVFCMPDTEKFGGDNGTVVIDKKDATRIALDALNAVTLPGE